MRLHRDAGAERDDLVRGSLGDEHCPVEQHAIEDVVSPELAADHLAGPVRIDGELEQLGPDQDVHILRRRAVHEREAAERRLDEAVLDAAAQEVAGTDELRRPAVRRREVELLRRALLDDRALAHERDPVGEREGLLAVVRDEHDGDADPAEDRRELVAHRPAQERIDVRPGLVEEDGLGRGRKRARESDALLLAAGELVREAVPERREADHLEQLRDAARTVAARDAEADVLRHGQVREEGVVLENHADAPPLGRHPRGRVRDRALEQAHLAAVRPLEARDQAQQRRLAAARGAEERYELAALDAEVGVVDGAGLFAVGAELEGRAEAAFEGAVMLAAAGLLTWMIFWMRRQARSLRPELEAKVEAALAAGSSLALGLVVFVAVVREGIETALFLIGSVASPASAVGGLLGLAGSVALGVLFFKGAARLDLRRFFTVTSVLLLLFAAW